MSKALELPRLIHKGDEKMRVDTQDDLDTALRQGWTLSAGEKPADKPAAAPAKKAEK